MKKPQHKLESLVKFSPAPNEGHAYGEIEVIHTRSSGCNYGISGHEGEVLEEDIVESYPRRKAKAEKTASAPRKKKKKEVSSEASAVN